MTLTSEQVRARLPYLARIAQEADGVAPLSEQTLLLAQRDDAPEDENGAHPAMMWHDIDGELVAVAVSDDSRTSYELVVHPAHRRRGHGAELLDRVIDEGSGSDGARVWAHGDLPPARSLADHHGMRVVRELWKMARPVQGDPLIEEPSLPTGFVSRSFRPGADDDAWLGVNARAFAHHPEQGRMTLADLRERMQQDWFDPDGLLLIEDLSGERPVLAASHWTKIEPPGAAEGEVYVVAVDPAYQGRGLGRAVTALGLAHLASSGVGTIDLYVEGDNAPAIATYRGWGFTKASADVMYTR